MKRSAWLCCLLSTLMFLVFGCRASEPEPDGSSTPLPQAAPASSEVPNKCGEIGTTPAVCAPQTITAASAAIPADACNPSGTGWRPVQGSFDHLSWQSFVALSWPADLAKGRGVADTTKTLGAHGPDGELLPVVWETYKELYEVFQYDNPAWTLTVDDWNDPQPVPPGCPSAPGARVLRMTSKAQTELTDNVDNGVNEAFTGPLVDQAGQLVWYEIRINQSEFDDIVKGSYYKKGADTGSLQFTDGAIEVKAAWKSLSGDETKSGRFFSRNVLVYQGPDGSQPATCKLQPMGLVGLHIARKTLLAPNWAWATFEHVDNTPEPGVPFPGKSSFFNPSCQPAVTAAECVGAAKSADPSDPKYQCCPNLQRYAAIGPGGAPLDRPRGPIQVTRLEPLSGASGCNAAYVTAMPGLVWQSYRLIGTQWLQAGDGPNPPKVTVPPVLRNTVLETYFVNWDPTKAPPVQTNTSSCMGCHAGSKAVDFSYVFLAATKEPVPLPPSPRGTIPVRRALRPPAK
jgi:hypothetical protein